MSSDIKLCPFIDCRKPLALMGSVGIVHWDNKWEAEVERWRCEGGHMIFGADEDTTKVIDEFEDEEREARDEAEGKERAKRN